ncbi:MAG: (2Fe-2S)-binding protein [Deltaproteobacteria bacterium]|nr:MAG: (2Fe-2S)-binding protein [Deltaproteobacteria bacterium]TMB30689.1 MAG: (2Fe-2S)-binding protein [Deltaproteobacteria bacterium]TMB32877.1 MAG: (2Fe-2S)-binding protein [Deltaproteobacteria bacterium]
MLVCLCRGVSDRVVREVIARGAGTLREVGRACGAGIDCGSCRDLIRTMIASCPPRGCEPPAAASSESARADGA